LIEHFELLKKLYGDEMKQLADIQAKLHVPKGNVNAFGKYKYRTCGDILEAVKPLLGGSTIKLSDELVLIGERYYVKATASLVAPDGVTESAVGYARESFDKKGMDDSQITGAASTYARKYALNGLLAIDDTEDADAMDNTKHKTAPINPTTGAWDNIGDDMNVFLRELASEVIGYMDNNNIAGAVEAIEIAKLEQHHKIALWTCFDSKQRAALKIAMSKNNG